MMRGHIALGVTGSIAAYKACEIVRLFVKAEYDVSVVMTDAATQFVTPLSFQTLSRNRVCTGLFNDDVEWMPAHISLANTCDALVVAPCTGNMIAKLETGIADDALSSLALAMSHKPLFVAPAMNVNMYAHPATQSNLDCLRSRGAQIIEPADGDLACGVRANGRMSEPEQIVQSVIEYLTHPKG